MILLTLHDGSQCLINPQYMIGCHVNRNGKTMITMVEENSYEVLESPLDIYDQDQGVVGVAGEDESCETCAWDGSDSPDRPCFYCSHMDEEHQDSHWEEREDEPETAETDGEMARVSGVPYPVSITSIGGAKND